MVPVFVVLTFALFLVVDYFVLKSQKKEHPAFMTFPVFNKSSITLPLQYMLSKGHIWLSKISDNQVKIGVDEFIVKSFKKLQLIDMAAEGTDLKKGDVVFRGKVGKQVVNFHSPIDGKVLTVNNDTVGKNITNPYTEGWGLVIAPATNNLSSVAQTAEKAANWLDSEFKRLKDFLSLHTADPELAGLTMADGGNITEGVAANFNEKTLAAFEKEFLS